MADKKQTKAKAKARTPKRAKANDPNVRRFVASPKDFGL